MEAVEPDPYKSGKVKSKWGWANIFNKCMESRGVFSLLHAPFYGATQVPAWAGLLSCSSAAGTNGCLDLSFRRCLPSGDENLPYRGILAPERGELKTVRRFNGEIQLVG